MRARRPHRLSSTRRGTGLAVVLMISSVLAMMVAAVGLNTMTHLQGTNANLYRKQAKHAAYGGVQWTLAILSKDSGWEPPGDKPYVIDMDGKRTVTAEIRVFNNNHGALGASYTAPDGTVVPKGAAYILVRGKAKNQRSLSTSTMSTMAYFGDSLPGTALFADQQLHMEDSATDSWTSFFENKRFRYDVADHGSAGSIGTNAPESGVVLLSSKVNGGLLLGAGAQRSATVVAADGSTIAGPTTQQEGRLRVQAHKPPEWVERKADDALSVVTKGGSVQPGAYDTIRVGKGETIRLSAGTYYVRNQLSLDGARLIIEPPGAVQIYVGGQLRIAGGSRVNPDDVGADEVLPGETTSGLPGNLQVLMVGNGNTSIRPTFEMSGGSRAWMSISGRTMAGSLTNSELFGNVKGEMLDLKGSRVHFDTATRTTGIALPTEVPTTGGVSEVSSATGVTGAYDSFRGVDVKGTGPGSGDVFRGVRYPGNGGYNTTTDTFEGCAVTNVRDMLECAPDSNP